MSVSDDGGTDIDMTNFFKRLGLVQASNDSSLCIGLDPDPGRLPGAVRGATHAVFEFNRAIIDATSDVVCCYKPQIAHYAAIAAERDLEMTIDYIKQKGIPLLLDAKRGDIGSTAERYAAELFERYGADAATINPYLGLDSIEPFLAWKDRGCFLLCRTSNPGGADAPNLMLDSGKQVYEHIAELAARDWNQHGNVGLVVGATQPTELARIRELTGAMTFLVPGIGAQGGDIGATMEAGQGGGLILSSSRQIIYAGEAAGNDFARAARDAAIATQTEINRFRNAA